ncbi:metastasis-suppressor KiSS-1 isoform X1 [Gorilla gorilla gorilla]|uniref:KiSS-1 metastasis suppressor n=1 Tax=Gorilla gorilla gorilla TaxID=9595 RepID=G3S6J4_GORGO|nr:metastasis-suppressor KiSS-1 isoform X1 [Gorilla gorilla gorilla]
MNSLVSWQLLLFLCATHFGEPLEKVASVGNSRPTGQQLESLGLLAPGQQSLPCTERKPAATARLSRRGTSLSPPPESSGSPQQPGLSAPHSRQIPAPQGAVLVQREKDLPNYNWNSFGLRFGKREAAPGNQGRSVGRG